MHHFPVTESTLSAVHLADYLREKYGLTRAVKCKLFRTGMNHLYHVIDGAQRFVLRIYNFNWRTKIEISEELRLLHHLRKNNVRVAYPIADTQGNFIHEINAPEGNRYTVLFSFAAGKKVPDFSAEASRLIGVTMATMHQATVNFELNRREYNTKTLLEDSRQHTRSFFTNTSDGIRWVESATDQLIQEYDKVNVGHVRNGAVHLDIWFDNLHFDENGDITIFDFDFCGNGWLCHDISYFLLQLFNTNTHADLYEKKARSFLDGYQSIVNISEEEERIIPFACVSVWLFYLGVQCEKFDTWSNVFLNEDHLRRFTGIVRKWIDYQRLPLG